MNADCLEIRGLKVRCEIGVPDGERAHPQELRIDLILFPERSFVAMNDQLEGGVDYAAAALFVAKVSKARPRKLIETLAANLADEVMKNFPVRRVEITVRKFILPETDWVAAKTFAEK